jgi:hypothetical protein
MKQTPLIPETLINTEERCLGSARPRKESMIAREPARARAEAGRKGFAASTEQGYDREKL